jgi:UDP-N-acetylmuramoylalanine--D-glutamate ligase
MWRNWYTRTSQKRIPRGLGVRVSPCSPNNMDYTSHFKGKKITVMGLGLLGRGLGVVKFLAECGADLIVTDLKTKEQLATSLSELAGLKGITFVLGEHRLEDFRDRDMIIKAAGVPLDSIYVAEARLHDVSVKMESSLFASITPATLIGITGTRGKSTTTHFVYESLKKHYKKGKVFLGGNVKGLATLPLLKEAKEDDLVVLELDSWQLQGFGDEKISPHIAVFTNFLPDHLNYYMRGGHSEARAMELYFADKANIFRHQNKSDYLVVSGEMAHCIIKKYPLLSSEIVTVHKNDLSEDWHLNILGEHNRENLAIGAAVLRVLGFTADEIKASIESFKGIPGRLELVREKGGVKIYNDTTSTTPVAAVAALEALGNADNKNVILIMGGADKQIDMTKLLNILPNYCWSIVLLPGTGTDTVREKIKKSNAEVIEVKSLQDAVSRAMSVAKAGDAVLFSPGFASFGLFQNEFDRGEQFDALVKKL